MNTYIVRVHYAHETETKPLRDLPDGSITVHLDNTSGLFRSLAEGTWIDET